MLTQLLRRVPALFVVLVLLISLAPLDAQDPPAEKLGEEETYSNVLKWSTASEVDNFGFDVYRGDQEEGPFERLTAEPIPGAGTTDEPSSYRYEDTAIDPHQAYWYYVESIAMNGQREQFTPIYQAKAKLPAEGEAAEPAEGGSEGEAENGES